MFRDWVFYRLAKKAVLVFRAVVFFFPLSVSAAEKNGENASIKAAYDKVSIN